nr:MAG TPA: hypothetical protein [Caudoviricetes sp.]
MSQGLLRAVAALSGNLQPASRVPSAAPGKGKAKIKGFPLKGSLPKRSPHFVQISSPRRLMRCR